MKNTNALIILTTLVLGLTSQAQQKASAPKFDVNEIFWHTAGLNSKPILVTKDVLLWEQPMREPKVTQRLKHRNTKTGKTQTVVVAETSGEVVEGPDHFKDRLPRMKSWTAKVFQIIRDETTLAKMNTPIPSDMPYFCPKYKTLNSAQRMTFWGQLVAAISYRESMWKSTTSFVEPDHKIDGITKRYVRSEGLMQLSYQDVSTHEDLNCGFDWKRDKALPPNSKDKTILQPFRNLRCGILILNKKVSLNSKISTPGTYWSVLRPVFNPRYADEDPRRGNKNSKLPWIAEQTRSLSFCK